jgi:hypothetical protein
MFTASKTTYFVGVTGLSLSGMAGGVVGLSPFTAGLSTGLSAGLLQPAIGTSKLTMASRANNFFIAFPFLRKTFKPASRRVHLAGIFWQS